jgi:integrase
MILALLYGLGLRVGEVSRLCRQDIDLDNQASDHSPDEVWKRSPGAIRTKDDPCAHCFSGS